MVASLWGFSKPLGMYSLKRHTFFSVTWEPLFLAIIAATRSIAVFCAHLFAFVKEKKYTPVYSFDVKSHFLKLLVVGLMQLIYLSLVFYWFNYGSVYGILICSNLISCFGVLATSNLWFNNYFHKFCIAYSTFMSI